MYEIESNVIWIGHASDVRDPQTIFDVGASAIVDVAFEEPPARLPRQLVYCRFPINDGGGNDSAVLRLSIQCVADMLVAKIPVLVACSAGLSRSPTIAAVALACVRNVEPESVLEKIAQTKALEVNGLLWSDAVQLANEIRI